MPASRYLSMFSLAATVLLVPLPARAAATVAPTPTAPGKVPGEVLSAPGATDTAASAAAPTGPTVVGIDFLGDVQDRDQARGLLSIQPGAPLPPASVREMISLYYATGRYAGIRVDTVPAPGGVRLQFTFQRQVLITGWRFNGNRHLDNGTLQRLLELQWGQALNPGQFPGFEQAVRDRYAREGYPRATVSFRTEAAGQGQVTLVGQIDEGAPVRVKAIEILRTGAKDAPDVSGALQLKPGAVLAREPLLAGMDRVEGLLSERGYLNSRVGYSFVLPNGTRTTNFDDMMTAKPDGVTLQVAVEAGQRALVAVEGHPLLNAQDMARSITVYKNRSYSPFELDASADRLRKLYVSNGYPDATVTHDVARKPDGSYLITFSVDPGNKVLIKRIAFEGNHAFGDKTLLAQMVTRPASFLDEGAFDPDIWASDLEDLKAFYATQGFLAARVTSVDRTLDASGAHMSLVVHVSEGPRTVVARLLVSGATRSQEAGILQALPIDPGAPYNPRKLPELISSVQAFYARTGFPAAQVTASYEPAPEVNGRIPGALRFKVVPGPEKRIGRVVLSGNVKTHDDVVRRQLTVKTGEVYNAEQLYQTQENIYQLGFFDRVEIQPLRLAGAKPDDPVDLQVSMHERETGSISLGGGYDDISTRPGPDVNAEYLENNLFGSGYPLRLEGEYGPSKKLASVTLRDPYLWNSQLVGEGGLTYQDTFETETFEVQRYGPTIGLSRQITKQLLGSFSYAWSHVTYLQYTASDLANAGGALDRKDSVFTAGITFDDRPDIMNPRWGNKLDFNVDLATPILGGTLLYTRPRLSLAHYFPLPRKIVFAVGGEADYIHTLGPYTLLPNDVRFLAGGANSLRGYDYNSVGLPVSCPAGSDPSACVTGGTVMAIGHLELRFPVWGDFGGVVFSDFGNVWDGLPSFGLADIKVTAGVGARYQTPVGPVRVDYGFRVRPDVEFGRNFYFGIGQAF